MRLDHLLSKEHFTAFLVGVVQSRAQAVMVALLWGGRGVSGVVLEGGTLTSSAGSCCCPQYGLVSLRRRGAWNGVVAGNRCVGTLLGPEGADRPGGTRGVVPVSAVLDPVPPCLLWEVAGSAGSVGGCLVVR